MDTDSMLDALQARGPHPDEAPHLMLFGQFVGAWDVDVTNIAPDGTIQELKGEWHFGWALEGRAIMDVWITPHRSLRGQAEPYEYGAGRTQVMVLGCFLVEISRMISKMISYALLSRVPRQLYLVCTSFDSVVADVYTYLTMWRDHLVLSETMRRAKSANTKPFTDSEDIA